MTDKSVEERRDEVIKRMLATPPQPKAPKKGKASRASDEGGRGAKPET